MNDFASRSRLRLALGAAAGLLLALAPAASAWAQAFPSRPVRIIVPFPPGGGIVIRAAGVQPE